jgi:hypothetical protein
MIKIPPNPTISRLLKRRTCATLIIVNAEKLPVSLLYRLTRISFITDMVNECKDFICVVPLGDSLDRLWNKLKEISSFSKEENV